MRKQPPKIVLKINFFKVLSKLLSKTKYTKLINHMKNNNLRLGG